MSMWGTLDEEMQEKVLSHVLDPVSQWSSAYRNLLSTSHFSNRYVNLYGKHLKELLFEYRKVHCPTLGLYSHVKALVPALRADLLLLFDYGQQTICTMRVSMLMAGGSAQSNWLHVLLSHLKQVFRHSVSSHPMQAWEFTCSSGGTRQD